MIYFFPEKASRTGWGTIVRQLAVEMWLPLLLATGWTAYSLYVDSATRTVRGGITVFGPSFFLTCWAFAQWHRVKKQQKVEHGLDSIEGRLDRAISSFNDRAAEIISNVTGGDGFCYLLPISDPGGEHEKKVLLVADRGWSLFDVSFTVIDWDLVFTADDKRWSTKVGEVSPLAGVFQDVDLGIEVGKSRNLKIDFWARNGRWRQHLLAHPIGSSHIFAWKVERGGVILHENVPSDLFVGPDGTVNWDGDVSTRLSDKRRRMDSMQPDTRPDAEAAGIALSD